MRKQSIINCMIIFLASALFFNSCAMRKSEPITGQTFIPANNRVANGEEVFMQNCQKCHPGGEGGLGPAINSLAAPAFIKQFQIRHGLGVMPSFKEDEISKQDLKDITNYLHAWKHYKK